MLRRFMFIPLYLLKIDAATSISDSRSKKQFECPGWNLAYGENIAFSIRSFKYCSWFYCEIVVTGDCSGQCFINIKHYELFCFKAPGLCKHRFIFLAGHVQCKTTACSCIRTCPLRTTPTAVYNC